MSAAVATLAAVGPLAVGAVPPWPEAVALTAGAALLGIASAWRQSGIVLTVIAVGSALVMADAVGRTLLDDVHVRPEDRYAELWRVDPPAVRYAPGVDTSWQTLGDLAALGAPVAHPRRVRFRTDSLGYRNDPLDGPAEVVLLGDSFAAGVGTSQEETVAGRLRRTHGLPTVTLAISGASPYDEGVMLDATLPRLALSPDAVLVWVLFAGNDFSGTCWDDLPAEPSAWNRLLARTATVRARSVLGHTLRRLRASPPAPLARPLPSGDSMAFYRPDLETIRLSEPEARDLPSATCVEQTIAHVQEITGREGLPLLVAVAPMKLQVYGGLVGLPDTPAGTASLLRSFAEERGIPVLDLEPALRRAAREGLPARRYIYWQDDTHWSPHGHALVAREIEQQVGDLRVSQSRSGASGGP
ncbi:MAG: GDSL-type esterase/lipase family protein [Bacteroidota bacterium]